MTEEQFNAWKKVIDILSQDVLGDEDSKVKIVSEQLQAIRDTSQLNNTTFLVRTILSKDIFTDV